MLLPEQRNKIVNLAKTLLDSPYLYGAKWSLYGDAKGPVDCSGYARWVYYNAAGITLRDGSYNQYNQCVPTAFPKPGDLGFLKNEQGLVYHVGIIYDDVSMIEARGNPYNKVILRPRHSWEVWKGFAGYLAFP